MNESLPEGLDPNKVDCYKAYVDGTLRQERMCLLRDAITMQGSVYWVDNNGFLHLVK